MTHDQLKNRHREVRDTYPPNLNLRIHRALSWWQRASLADDDDGRYIFLWIAFNAAYATQMDDLERPSESVAFQGFLEKLCGLDLEKRIDALVWEEYSGRIRVLLDTPYVFQSFWDFHNGKITEAEWQKRFERGKQKAHYALGSGNTPMLLGVMFNRLYTLRNQLIHGGATWNGSVNRKQLRDCTQLLGSLVPILIQLMLDNPNTLWGEACYPVIR
ncbi:hypothetical protein [Castellaniella sp.]|uniref:hypothetical protein n=1 Tax=Castellaniella sp. TaxID=1955812 RepID=UPI002B0005C0|nr:hypothetical protein [Castellaniella sp.]